VGVGTGRFIKHVVGRGQARVPEAPRWILSESINGRKGLENQGEDQGDEEKFSWASSLVAMILSQNQGCHGELLYAEVSVYEQQDQTTSEGGP
jgi:hypothetical protein